MRQGLHGGCGISKNKNNSKLKSLIPKVLTLRAVGPRPAPCRGPHQPSRSISPGWSWGPFGSDKAFPFGLDTATGSSRQLRLHRSPLPDPGGDCAAILNPFQAAACPPSARLVGSGPRSVAFLKPIP